MAELADARGPVIRAAAVNRWSSGVRPWFIGGTVLSLLGFALPWFRVSRSYDWYYGGWSMLTTNEPGLWWISLLFLGYAIVLLAGFWLHRFDAISVGLLAALAIGVALGTLVVVALAAADAVQDQGRVYRIDLSIGLFLMLPAHGLMIVAVIAGFALQLLRDLLSEDAALWEVTESESTGAMPGD